MKNVEILAPAGNYDCFLAAVNAGADAVYLGGNMYGARAFAGNFCKEDLLKALDHAHVLDKKIYLTVNTLLSNSEIDNGLYDFIAPLYENGLDAVIVQDLGAAYFLHENFKDLPLHASTQMTITNFGFLNTLKENGFTRIVPARELSLNEIKKLSNSSDLEIECFVHGALCYCYSGQCMLSFSRGGRSGNKGRCAQPCRLLYETAGKESYFLSPKDLCVLDSIPDLIDAGIDSFKIEGRMKKPEYVANAAYLYKKWANRYLTLGKEEYEKNEDSFKAEMRKDLIRLSDMYNRGGFTKGFYYMHNGPEIMSVNRPNHYGTFVADVVKVTGKDMTLLAKEDINAHDVIEVRKNDKEIYEFTTGKSYNKGDSFVMNYKKGLKIDEDCLCYRIRNNELIDKINDDLKISPAKRDISISCVLTPGSEALYTANAGDISYELKGDTVQAAANRPVEKERIISALSATGDTLFNAAKADVTLKGDIFIPIGALKEARRNLLSGLYEKMINSHKRTLGKRAKITGFEKKNPIQNTTYSRLVRTLTDLENAIKEAKFDLIYIPLDEPNFYDSYDLIFKKVKESGKMLGVVLPVIFREKYNDISYMPKDADVYLASDIGELYYLESLGIPKSKVRLNHNLYVWNRYTYLFHKKNGYDNFTVNLEQSYEEAKALLSDPLVDPLDFEYVAKTRLPLMTSAGCIIKTTGSCVKTGARRILKAGNDDLEVVCNCRHCYNMIFDNKITDNTEFTKANSELIRFLRYDN